MSKRTIDGDICEQQQQQQPLQDCDNDSKYEDDCDMTMDHKKVKIMTSDDTSMYIQTTEQQQQQQQLQQQISIDDEEDDDFSPEGVSTTVTVAHVQQLEAKLKSLRQKYRECVKLKRDQDQKLDHVKRGWKCSCCLDPCQVITLMPCGLHGSCFTCMVKHVIANTSFQEDPNNHELGGSLVFKATCPICRHSKTLNDTLDGMIVPPCEVQNFHYAFLKKAITTCPYCSISITPNVSDAHVRRCTERKHPCPRKGCRVKFYKPSIGYKHHLETDCTGFKCIHCRKCGLTMSEQIQHRKQHAEGAQVWENISNSIIEVHSLIEQRTPFMKLEHVQHLKQFMDSIKLILVCGNDKFFETCIKQVNKFYQTITESASHHTDFMLLTDFQAQAKMTSDFATLDEQTVQRPVRKRIYDVEATTSASVNLTATTPMSASMTSVNNMHTSLLSNIHSSTHNQS